MERFSQILLSPDHFDSSDRMDTSDNVDGVEEAFLHAIREQEKEPVEMVKKFEKIIKNRISHLDSLLAAEPPGVHANSREHSHYAQLRAERQLLRLEYETWALISLLFSDRLLPSSPSLKDLSLVLPSASDELLVAARLLRDRSLREIGIAIAWLQKIFWEDFSLFNAPHSSLAVWDGTGTHKLLSTRRTWEPVVTLDELPSHMRTPIPAHRFDLNGSLLPDLRSHDSTSSDSRDLEVSERLFILVRAGRINEAMLYAERCGQPARKALIPSVLPAFFSHILQFRRESAERGEKYETAEEELSAFHSYISREMNRTPSPGNALFHDDHLAAAALRASENANEPSDTMEIADRTKGSSSHCGNIYARIYRQTARRIAEGHDANVNRYDRALCGCASGVLDAITPTCASWHDHLWAALVALFQSHISALTHNPPLMETSRTRPENRNNESNNEVSTAGETERPHAPNISATLAEIINGLRASPHANIRRASESPYHRAQALILQGSPHIQHLLPHLAQYVAEAHETPNPTNESPLGLAPPARCHPALLRFAAHLVIFLATAGVPLGNGEENSALATRLLVQYVDYLVRKDKKRLVAGYTSLIVDERVQVELYARFLASLSPSVPSAQLSPAQTLCLQWADEAGLDVSRITKYLVEYVITRPTPSSHAVLAPAPSLASTVAVIPEPLVSIPPRVDPADLERIAALGWLTYDGAVDPRAQRLACLRTANALARTLVLEGRMDAHLRLLEEVNRLLPDLRDISDESDDSDEISLEWDIAVREHVALRLYAECQRAYAAWHAHRLRAPRQPSTDSHGSPDDMATALLLREELKRYNETFRAWKLEGGELGAKLERACLSILTYPTGWLVERTLPSHPQLSHGERRQQLEAIRKLCIPDVCFRLFALYFDTKEYKKCLQIADIVADSRAQLHAVFSLNALEHLLDLFRLAGLNGVHQPHCDSFGYNL